MTYAIKKRFVFSALVTGLMIMLSLTACQVFRSPADTVTGYLNALAKLDFVEASHYVVATGQARFNTLQQLSRNLTPPEQEKFRLNQWQLIDIRQEGARAWIQVKLNQKVNQLVLIQEQGVWKIDQQNLF